MTARRLMSADSAFDGALEDHLAGTTARSGYAEKDG